MDLVKKLQMRVREAQQGARDWRSESWRDAEMFDGGRAQWSDKDWESLKSSGMTPVTINRIFPVVNLINGAHIVNRQGITAKARTSKDSEISQVMTEGIQYVLDQSDGEFVISKAFKDAIVSGFGCVFTGVASDPRRERVRVKYWPWTEVWWDPFASPWWSPETCRYVFRQRWVDLDDLSLMFFDKKDEINDHYEELTSSTMWDRNFSWTESDAVEQMKQELSGQEWADRDRRRVRPVDIWYPVWEKSNFAVMPNSNVIELSEERDSDDLYDIIMSSKEVVSAPVRRMHVTTFVGDLVLQDMKSPFGHDEYPMVPFIGYEDRFGFPYGVPRQIRGQNEEVNKRRTMALNLLKSRRVAVEEDAVGGQDANKQDSLQNFFEEAQSQDGFLVLRPGKLQAYKIEEMAQLAPAQFQVLEQSEREIQEVSGANNERMGLESNAVSGTAIEARQRQGSMMTAELFDNLRRSNKMIGERIVPLVQKNWGHEKILRITDRMTGADRFVAVNERVIGANGEVITVRNDITQSRYDLVVSASPVSDTVREQYMQMVIEWIKKSPPETVPLLMNMAFELSNLPNKDQFLSKVKSILGVDPSDEDLSPEELKTRAAQEAEAKKQAESEQYQMSKMAAQMEIEKSRAEVQKLMAEADAVSQRARAEKFKVVTDARARETQSEVARRNVDVNAFRAETEAIGRDEEHRRSVLDLQAKMAEMDEKTKREEIKASAKMGAQVPPINKKGEGTA